MFQGLRDKLKCRSLRSRGSAGAVASWQRNARHEVGPDPPMGLADRHSNYSAVSSRRSGGEAAPPHVCDDLHGDSPPQPGRKCLFSSDAHRAHVLGPGERKVILSGILCPHVSPALYMVHKGRKQRHGAVLAAQHQSKAGLAAGYVLRECWLIAALWFAGRDCRCACAAAGSSRCWRGFDSAPPGALLACLRCRANSVHSMLQYSCVVSDAGIQQYAWRVAGVHEVGHALRGWRRLAVLRNSAT